MDNLKKGKAFMSESAEIFNFNTSFTPDPFLFTLTTIIQGDGIVIVLHGLWKDLGPKGCNKDAWGVIQIVRTL